MLAGRSRRSFSHALPSALLTLSLLKQMGVPDEDAFLYAESVRLHHSGMASQEKIWDFWEDEDKVDEYLRVINNRKVVDFVRKYIWSDFSLLVVSDIIKSFDVFDLLPDDRSSEDEHWLWYIKLRTALSCLVAADRVDAVFGEPRDVLDLMDEGDIRDALDKIKEFVDNAPQTPINEWRHAVREEVLGRYEAEYGHRGSTSGVISLSLPTGAGKTLISLTIALKHMLRAGANRIIYVLPYISVGEQVADVISRFVGSDRVMVDNYLSRGRKDNEQLSGYEILTTIMRYWVKPVVVTTSVFMWDVLFGPSAMDTMNFHLLKNAIIIFDEVQSIPTEFWGDLGKFVEYLGRENLVILMSATQPIEVRDSIRFESSQRPPVSRYKLEEVGSGYIVDSVAGQIEKNKSVLCIFNTRSGALRFYVDLKEKIHGWGDNLYFLSTYVIPKHRAERIAEIVNAEKRGKQRVLVSTQVVEAGVDLSFDVVFREFAPLDSIIQSAGRCGRHGEVVGQVFVIYPSDTVAKIYGAIKSDVSKEMFESVRAWFPVDEYRLFDMQGRYFKELSSRKQIYTLTRYCIAEGKYDMECKDIKTFRLISESFRQYAVVIPADDEAMNLLEEIRRLYVDQGLEKFDRINRRKQLYAKLSQYIVNLPQGIYSKLKSNREHIEQVVPNGEMIIVRPDYVSNYYTKEYGWFWGLLEKP